MLSLQQAIEIKESIISYLKATFTFRKRPVAEAFDAFINHPTQGMFKGPYLSLKLCFVKAEAEEIEQAPLQIKPLWQPYDHQIKSWVRLSTLNKKPEPTIVTTGTGSGKTESFLYPVLDYCYQQQHRPGIKAIILYPMNALATDQAKRLAEAIYEDERLRGKITAGLFIGEGNGAKNKYPKTMDEGHIIEHRDTILDAPPDIVLTNFKMLDYALMKHNFHSLWRHNLKDSSLLQFLVLDELHTYDGAQGTDVANLIRRLKLKLQISQGQLCPVGTSATIGSGHEAPQLLADYATKVFGETVDTSAIITENRISVDEFFGSADETDDFLPHLSKLRTLEHQENETFEQYLNEHISVWQLDATQPADGLLRLKIVKDLVIACNKGKGNRTLTEVIRDLSVINNAYRKVPQWDEEYQFNPKERIIESLLTLISYTREKDNPRSPFMYLQVQLWIRELSGVQYTLDATPQFTFRDRVDAKKELAALPPWYCRECNSSGWLGVKNDNRDVFAKDINEVYEKFFAHNKNVYFILPGNELNYNDFRTTGYQPDDFLQERIDTVSLKLLDKSEEGGVAIQALRKLRNNKTEHICPCCNSLNTVAIIGTKIPTLSSIAVSQTLATDLDSATEKDRKVLAFTNAVQDAAHQAGFIEARNYRFTFRASIQKVINEHQRPIRLDELSQTFIDYWKENADETGTDKLSGYLYRFFPKDYIGKASPKDYKSGNSYYENFLTEFDLRIQWEMYAEFGFNSLIGRTLEKTGASSVCFDDEKIREAWLIMYEWLKTNDVTHTINEEDWLRFTCLILHRTRQRGAINHTFLDKFREERFSLWDLNWQKDSRHFLNPKFGTRSRLPKLLTNQEHRGNLLDTTNAKNTNWFHAYFKKSFISATDTPYFISEFYDQWTKALVDTDILEKKSGAQDSFAINPAVIWVKKNVRQYVCNKCEHVLYTQDKEQYISGSACLNYRCTGQYTLETTTHHNYYKSVYNRNRFPRIYAAEHTGLLERKIRENLEIDFKEHPRFNSVNALVATSTLEMGIDIGTLNTAYNNSVSPLPSNFMQRVGRAGRSSGSALIVNFAKHQNHDLYYFTDPLEMMQGEVNTPGCYLEARDILRRHFTAFCIDSWTSNNPNDNTIPTFIRDLRLESRSLTETDFFVNKINNFIKTKRIILCYEFLQHYSQHIAEQTFEEIKNELENDNFYMRLFRIFELLKNELHELENKRKELDDKQNALKLAKGDPLYEEFNREKRNLQGIKTSIRNRSILEHLTNEGVLPNYAFPETGVRLNAHVTTSRAEGTDNISPDKDYEIIRSAAQAIKEFAPENFFYTQGYRFEITGVNTFDWSDRANYHSKRFCSRCDYLEDDSLATKGNCPKCGDPSWSSSSNVHNFVKLTSVKSFNDESKASLTDANDDRDNTNYQLMNHINIHQHTSEGAWVLKDIPFGIEYVKSAVISGVNYGRGDVMDARKLKINDAEVMTKGFVTCRHCGKSSSATHHPEHKYHYGFCKHRDVKYNHQPDNVFDEVYFFREIQTEILKVVLPIQEFNSEADIRMFQAGIELGLKKFFKGNPGHIRILSYKEFNKKTDKFDRFLILYDTIPGGTGYLEKLFDYNEFSLLLRLSYEAIRDCGCQLEGKDGCYKCIYSYSNQYKRGDMSRTRAEKWFADIVSKTEEWEKKSEGLTSLTNTGKIEESELEERFIKLLSVWANKTNGFDFRTEKNDGVVSYKLLIKKGDIDALYWIRPQIAIGPKDGIAYSTRTDFLISCGKYIKGEVDAKEQIKNIAIYLDGYQYHASTEHNIFERDLRVRQSIAQHQQYISWTLTWKDLDYFEKEIGGDKSVSDELSTLFDTNFKLNYTKLLSTIRVGDKINYSTASINVERLINQMIHPVISSNENSWYLYLACWTKELLKPSFNPNALNELIKGRLTEDNYLLANKINDFDALLPVQEIPVFDFANWRIWVNIKERNVFHSLETATTNGSLLSHHCEVRSNLAGALNKEQWELFWLYFNIFQSEHFISEQNMEEEEIITIPADALFEEIRELYSEEYENFIRQCIRKDLINKLNKETLNSLLNEQGAVIAEAEFVFMEQKVAIEPFTKEDEKVFETQGYKIYKIDQLNDIMP